MEASHKSEAIENELKGTFGFDRRDSISNNCCVPTPIGCGFPITGFKDAASYREYKISGLCQNCQDKIFGGSTDDGL